MRDAIRQQLKDVHSRLIELDDLWFHSLRWQPHRSWQIEDEDRALRSLSVILTTLLRRSSR
jgi:hypothetical protein